MSIQLYKTPQRTDTTVSVSVSGETLTINGVTHDLSDVEAPVTIDSPFIIGPVFRLEGYVHVRVVAPYKAGETPDDPDEMPETPVVTTAPRSTAMWRARAVAKATPYGEGTLYEAVVSAIEGLGDPLTKAAAGEAWERGTTFDLDGQLVPALMAALELTEADVLPLIEAAESLPA